MIIKMFELWKDHNEALHQTGNTVNVPWSIREVLVNTDHIVRILPAEIKWTEIKKNCSDAVRLLKEETRLNKVIFVEGQHASSFISIGDTNLNGC